MKTAMKSVALVLPVLLVAACHTGGPSLGPSPFRVSYGDFRFNEHPSGLSNAFEGTISVIADEIQVDTRDSGCFTVVTNDPKARAFSCGEYTVHAAKIAEGWEFMYATQREVEQKYKVCDSYKTQNGQQVCVSTREETRIRKIPVTGRIHLQAEAMAGITPPQH